jgi:hypothetical protein
MVEMCLHANSGTAEIRVFTADLRMQAFLMMKYSVCPGIPHIISAACKLQHTCPA